MCSQAPPISPAWKSALIVQYTTVGLSVLTIPLYVLVITILLQNLKCIKQNKAFFVFFLINGFVDIVSILANALGNSFPAWGLFLDFYLSHGTLVGKIYLVLMYWTRYSQGVNTLLLAFNRSTAVLFPFRYGKIWSKRWVKVCIAIQLLFGVPVGILVACSDYFWRLDCSAPNLWDHLPYVQRAYSDSQVLVIIFSDARLKTIVLGVSFSAEVVFFLIIVCNYAFMVITLRRQRRRDTTVVTHLSSLRRDATIQRQKFMLLRMAVIICLLELCYAVFGVVSVVGRMNSDQFHFFYNLVTTIYSSMGPYLMICFSTTTRRLIRATFAPKQPLLYKASPPQPTITSRSQR
ncbi:hypothetical protein QR680_004657 [Steinernema hermaphroditum]|uniref:G-protein coupled receptors family 1 profile domain-containing protein n=1 Tax=Steinernema hermaphroditum TaxID=289476 RepID=A0AA39LUC2_9BILA|nr:hypothetical protein QR680_004657 [Steinernema hermaphroditum]